MRTRIITAYTPDFFERASVLVASGQAQGVVVEAIPYDVVHEDWLHNMRHRPRIILNELAKGRPVLWIDADATILQPFSAEMIEMFEERADYAGCRLEPGAARDRRFRGMPQFWNVTPAALHMCRRFAELSEEPIDGDDEWFLEAARLECPDARLGYFPDAYCWVPDIHPMPPPPDVVVVVLKSSGKNPFRADGTRRSGVWRP